MYAMTANIAFPGADRLGTVIAVHATAPSRLLAGSFIPPKNVKALRDLVRCRKKLVKARGGAPPLREELVRPQRTMKGKESTHSPPLSIYSAPGGLRQDPGRAAESLAGARTCGNGSREMRVLLPAYGSRGDVEPLAGLAVRLRALAGGAGVRPPTSDRS